MPWLAFADRRQERWWEQKQAADQAGLDAAVSIQTLLFPSLVARTLWDQLTSSAGGGLPLEALWLAVFLGWALLHLLLAQLSPGTYLRCRTPIVLLSRLQRQLTIMRYAALFNREAMGLAGAVAPTRALPATLGGMLGMLLWRHAAAVHCRSGTQAQAAEIYLGIARRLRDALMRAGRSGGSSGSLGGTCLDPGAGSGGGTCGAGGCMGACVAVHGWLQLVLGALLPLAVMWAVEERSRLRFQRQWLQHHVVVGEEEGSTHPTAAGSGAASSAQGQRSAGGAGKLPAPVPGIMLAAWLAACAWALWLELEGFLL
ncbi:hypothetical protein ABPG75_010729 [Micractinium tetrahymenae]